MPKARGVAHLTCTQLRLRERSGSILPAQLHTGRPLVRKYRGKGIVEATRKDPNGFDDLLMPRPVLPDSVITEPYERSQIYEKAGPINSKQPRDLRVTSSQLNRVAKVAAVAR